MFIENYYCGLINLTLALIFFAYYTIWVIGLPFVDSQVDNPDLEVQSEPRTNLQTGSQLNFVFFSTSP
jgi:hypothetical protein